MTKSLIERIQDWYKNNCDGDWEHQSGIRIETLDNPGWNVTIDLEDTSLEDGEFYKQYEKAEDDWLIVKIEEKKFIGCGDPDKLNEILRIFLEDFLPKQSDQQFLYQIFVPVLNTNLPVWRPVEAKVINESIFEIVKIPAPDLKEIQILDIDDFSKLPPEVNLNNIDFHEGDKITCELKLFFENKRLIVDKKIKS